MENVYLKNLLVKKLNFLLQSQINLKFRQWEVDVMGNLHKGPDQALNPASFQIQKIQIVGGYALQVFWADGHNTGLYSYDLLRELREKG